MLYYRADQSGENTESDDIMVTVQRCPLCSGLNQCAVAAGTEPSGCWCFSRGANIRELLREHEELAEHYSRQTSCICSVCVSQLSSEHS